MSSLQFECRTRGGVPEIRIYDNIGAPGADVSSFADKLASIGNVPEIRLCINSNGGEVFTGHAIYNLLRQHPAKITVRIDGVAASSASLIAMAGDRIEMPRSAWMMIHEPHTVQTVGATADDHEYLAERLRGLTASFIDIYAERTRQPADKIAVWMKHGGGKGFWMQGDQAVQLGFATDLIDAPAMAASVDLSAYEGSLPQELLGLLKGGIAAASTTPEKDHSSMAHDTKTAATVQPNRETAIDEICGNVDVQKEAAPKWTKQEVNGASSDEVEARANEIVRARLAAIQGAYRAGENLGLQTECQQLLDKGFAAEDVPGMLTEIFKRKSAKDNAVRAHLPSGIEGGVDHTDPKLIVGRMSDAIAAHYTPDRNVPEAAREYMGYRPSDMMRDLLGRRGVRVHGISHSELIEASLHSTSDFPKLLGVSANKIFLGSYNSAPSTFRSVMQRQDFANFQVHDLLRDGDFPQLKLIAESGEITDGTMSENSEPAKLDTYGRAFSVSRQMLINDSLGVFGRTVAKMGQSVARHENRIAWAKVVSNPVLSDGVAFFHANHGNLAGSNGAIEAATLGAGRTAMRLQKSLDGETLNVTPRFLVVPATKETVAEQVLSPLFVPTTPAGTTTASQRSLNVVVEPLLDGNSLTAWYLFSEPSQGAAFIYGYLEGDSAPRIATVEQARVDGVSFMVRLDFYCAPVDHRFAYKNLGA